jgi:molybdate transport system permease protein
MNIQGIAGTLLLSVRIGLAATAVNLLLAMPLAGFLARNEFRGKAILDGMINLPLVMPPVTTGYLLLLVLGKRGLVGSLLYSWFGMRIAFTTSAAVIASMAVSFPLVVRSVRISMEMADRRLEDVARTLGAGKLAVFIRVTLPLILPGLVNGAVLGFARSLGEFGATMTFAGNILGETRTIPLSVYALLQIPGKEREAGTLVAVSVAVSFAAMFLSSAFGRANGQKRAPE